MSQNTVKAVIFDHDGTLVNSEPVHLRCWNAVLEAYGASLAWDDYAHHLSGMPSRVSAQWLVGKFNLDTNPDALLSAKQKLLREFLTSSAYPLMPEVAPLLEYLHCLDIPLAIASGADRDEVRSSLNFHGFARYFRAVATNSDVANNKPAPDVYLLAAKQLGVAPQDCIAIEDSDNGEKAARAASMRCLRLHSMADGDPAALRYRTLAEVHDWFTQTLGG